MTDNLRLSAPTHCSINVTNACNLACKHCSSDSQMSVRSDMSGSQLQALIDALDRIGIVKVDITGGEPLMRQDIFEVFSALKRKRIPAKLLTNATLVSDEVAHRLASDAHITEVSTSLDGGIAQTHDALRGKGAFGKALAGVEALRRNGFQVHVTCVVNRLNMDELEAVALLTMDKGATVVFSAPSLIGRAQRHRDLFEFTRAEREGIFDAVCCLKATYENVRGGTILEWPVAKARAARNMTFERRRGAMVGSCSICKQSIAVTAEGYVVPCNNFHGYHLGSILEEDILTIYRSSRAEEIRAVCRLTSDQLVGCGGCVYTCVCSGGCRALAYDRSGSLRGVDITRCLRHHLETEDGSGQEDR